jgi:hypothetical protein
VASSTSPLKQRKPPARDRQGLDISVHEDSLETPNEYHGHDSGRKHA